MRYFDPNTICRLKNMSVCKNDALVCAWIIYTDLTRLGVCKRFVMMVWDKHLEAEKSVCGQITLTVALTKPTSTLP